MKNNLLKKLTIISFLSLATFPLLRENVSSMLIIITVFLTIINLVKSKKLKPFKSKFWILTSLFWMFLLHEIVFLDFNFKRILLYLPFLIFPLLFFYKPDFIDEKTKKTSIKIFQLSSILQIVIYVILFLYNQPLNKFFYTRQNVPFFREYVSENYLFDIHPTYFSSFLLISFTISLVRLFTEKQKNFSFNIPNILLMGFFIFLFSSRMVILILLFTIFITPVFFAIKGAKKESLIAIISSICLLVILVVPQKDVFKRRFNEIKTEINKPIINDYHNSTNIRVAIFRCTIKLLKEVPFFGFGDDLQNKLNACYADTNNSDFYKIAAYNTHNYYFKLLLYGGWLFLISFFIYIFFIYKYINYSILGVFVLLQLLALNLTENYFSRHYGIVLFSYFTSLLIFVKREKYIHD